MLPQVLPGAAAGLYASLEVARAGPWQAGAGKGPDIQVFLVQVRGQYKKAQWQ